MRRTFQDLAREAAVADVVTRSISGHATATMQAHYSTARDHEVSAGSLALIARGLKTPRGRWVYVGREGDDMFHVRFHSDDDGAAEELFIDSSELSRAFTLAADYYLTARPVFDTPRQR